MIEIEGRVTYVSDEDLKFVIDHKGKGVAPKDRDLALGMMTERILKGDSKLIGYFYTNENIPQALRTEVFNQYYTAFPVHKMDWEGLTKLLLSPDKKAYISQRAVGNEKERITPAIIAAQIKFAIDAIPSSNYCLTSSYADPLKYRQGNSVGKAWLSNMQDAGGLMRISNIPPLNDGQMKELQEKHKLVITGTDGRQYFLKHSFDEVYAYRNESKLPKEAEAAFLAKYIKETVRARDSVYDLVEFASKHLEYELWHRETAWNAALKAVSHRDMHALYAVIDKKHRNEKDWTCDYPQEWVQPAKDRLRELQESCLKEVGATPNADSFHALSSIYDMAQSQEIKKQAHDLMAAAYVARIDEKIAKGENIDYECRTKGDFKLDMPVEIIEKHGKPKLYASYRAQIARATKDPQIYWQLERMRDGGRDFENTPPIIRKEAGEALETVVGATVKGMWQVKRAQEAPEEPVKPIVEDKKETVKELGKKLATPKKQYWLPGAFKATMAAIKRL